MAEHEVWPHSLEDRIMDHYATHGQLITEATEEVLRRASARSDIPVVAMLLDGYADTNTTYFDIEAVFLADGSQVIDTGEILRLVADISAEELAEQAARTGWHLEDLRREHFDDQRCDDAVWGLLGDEAIAHNASWLIGTPAPVEVDA